MCSVALTAFKSFFFSISISKFVMAGSGVSTSLILVGASGCDGSSPGARSQEKEPFYVSERQKLNKVNGFFPRSQDRPVLVISPEAVMEDVDYLATHALICKFLGIHNSLSEA